MLVRPRVLVDLVDLGFRHFAREYAAHALATLVHMQHHLHRALLLHAEEHAQHLDHELHRRVVIVEQHHLEHGRTLQFRLGGFQRHAVFVFGFRRRVCGHRANVRFHRQIILCDACDKAA